MKFSNWFRSPLANRPIVRSRRATTKQKALFQPTLEVLEDRTVPSAVAPPSGLVSWWTADNTAADLKGLNNATLSNGTTYAASEVGQGFSFDGIDDRADVTDANSLKFTTSMSIEGWIQVRGYTGFILFRGDNRGGLDPYTLAIGGAGRLSFQINNGTDSGSFAVSAPIALGQLIHVAATLDDATGAMKLYENGAVVAQGVTAIRPFRDLDPTQNPGIGIGTGNPTFNAPFNGLIDELAVYNRALTPNEVQAIYSAGTAGKIKSSTYLAADFPIVTEGAAGSTTPVTFTINRVGNLSGQAVVSWTTANNTATAGSDYVAASGQVVFQDGESQKTVRVTVNGDNTPESNETFNLELSTTTPGYAVGMGQATITEDDVGISINNGTATEGDARLGQSMGAFISQATNGGLNDGETMSWGPDGNLYVGSLITNQILKYDGTTGVFLGVFIDSAAGLAPDAPFIQGLQFRPDGKLYVLSRNATEVQRFNAVTGAFLDNFIPSGSGGLNAAKGMTVGPDGNWYISSGATDQVFRYSGSTGAFLGVFVAAGSGGASNPRALIFGPDGNLYVTSGNTDNVLRYSGQTGAFLNAFVPSNSGGLKAPSELLFRNGSLYVGSQNTNEILRYDAQTGAFLDKATNSGDLDQPIGLLFDSNGNLLVSNRGGTMAGGEILRYGPRSLASFTVRLNIPSAIPVTVNYTTADLTAKAGTNYKGVTSGTVFFAPGEISKTVLIQTLDDGVTDPPLKFAINLSSPTNATISQAQGIGTIIDANQATLSILGFPTTTTAGVVGTLNVLALDDKGNIVPGYRGTVHFTSSDSQAVLPANYTFTGADNGVHSFSATLKTAGTQSIVATDTATDFVTGSETGINVNAASAAAIVFSNVPTAMPAGSAFNLETKVEDAFGNIVVDYTGLVFFTSSDLHALLPANYQFTAADQGAHSFAFTLKTVGSQSITASDTGSLSASATGIGVTAANAAALVLGNVPTTTPAGKAFTLNMKVEDAFGNIITGYASTVHFTSSDPLAVLPADYTFTTADQGMHSFTFTLMTAGSQAITASATVMGSATGIDVIGPKAPIVFSNVPTSTAAGSAFRLNMKVEDAFGDTVTGYTGMVHFTSTDPQAVLPADYTFTTADEGMRSFTVTLYKAGNQSITATDTVKGTITGTSLGIVVSTGTVLQPVLVQENFVVNPDYTISGQRFDASGHPTGSLYQVAPGSLKSIVVGRDASGDLVLFGIDPYKGWVWELPFYANGSPRSNTFINVWNLGTLESLAVGNTYEGNLELFAVDPYFHYTWAMKFDANDKKVGGFALVSAAGLATTLTVGHDAKNNPLVFTIDRYFSQVQELKFDVHGNPVGSYFRPGSSFAVKSIAVGNDTQGNAEIFALDPYFSHTFYLNLDANSNAANPFFLQASMATVAQSIAVGHDIHNNPILFAITPDYQVSVLHFDNTGKPVKDFQSTGASMALFTALQVGYSQNGFVDLFGLGLGNSLVYLTMLDGSGNPLQPFAVVAPGAVKGLTVSQ